MKLRRSLYARPEIRLRTALHRRCARLREADRARTLRHLSRTASNLPATRPHITTASTVSLHCELCAEQHSYEATRGCVLRCERRARQWHARGQGFKSPQLHQAQRIGSTPAEGRLPENCQTLTHRVHKNALSADWLGALKLSAMTCSYLKLQLKVRPCGRPSARQRRHKP
jgi:hypothetical protein